MAKRKIKPQPKYETYVQGGTVMKAQEGRPSWKNRRKVIFLTLLFCAFCVGYIMFQGNDTRINETIVLGCFGLAGSVIGFYVAGAAWTDISIEKIKAENSPSDSVPLRRVVSHEEVDDGEEEVAGSPVETDGRG